MTQSHRTIIHSDDAPAAIGTYSQAVRVDQMVYLSGQIPLVASSMTMISEDFAEQTHQVFRNLRAVCQAAGGDLKHIVKLNIFMTDLSNFSTVNTIMAEYFSEPYPARAALGVNQLPKESQVEMDAIACID